jgi:uncharacterized RDD family membrane protein YckC
MDNIEIEGQKSVKYAGFWIRLLAVIIDVVFICIIFYFAAKVFGFNVMSENPSAAESVVNYIAMVVLTILFVASNWQGTPGKKVCGLYVGKKDGDEFSKLRYGRAIARTLVPFIVFMPMLVLALFIPSLSDGEIRGFNHFQELMLETSQASEEGIMPEMVEQLLPWFLASVVAMFFMLVIWYGFAGWTKEKTALHDIICGTRVLKGRPDKS